jgi:hypothetical protein
MNAKEFAGITVVLSETKISSAVIPFTGDTANE